MDPTTYRRLTSPNALVLMPSGKFGRVIRLCETGNGIERAEVQYLSPEKVMIDPTLLRAPLQEDVDRLDGMSRDEKPEPDAHQGELALAQEAKPTRRSGKAARK